MKQGGRYAKKSAGFTILETMIVLAVSAGLFLIAALYIGGKQARTEFQVGVRNIQTQLQQIINQTESGYYGAQGNSRCSIAGPATSNLSFPAGTDGLGTRGDCIFIGKAIVVDSTQLYVYSLVGARQVAGEDTSDPKTARATVAGTPETFVLPNGITLAGSLSDGVFSSGAPRGFSFLSSMASASGSATGSQTFDLYGFTGTFVLNRAPDIHKVVIDSEMNKTPAYPAKKSVGICVKSGGTNQWALITIGGTSGLAVRTVVKGNATCS